MSDVSSKIGEGLEQSFLMAYEVWHLRPVSYRA